MNPVADWGLMTQAERDAAYNNAAAVPDRERLIRIRNEAGERYRALHPSHLDIPYGPSERTKWDLYPVAEPGAPCLVFVHGGYWQMNRREDFAGLAEGVAAHGWSVAMPGYSLAPEASLTQIIAELRVALDWLSDNRTKYGIAGPVFISGWSAGGNMAALLLDHDLIQAGLAISGVFELGPIRDTYLNENLQLSDGEISAFSPLRHPAIAKPLAIAYGTNELAALVNDSRNLHRLRAASHTGGILLPVPGADHFSILEELASPCGGLTQAILGLHRR
jgi:arylformamidase